ncbi:MAG: hypothetical protein RRA94_01970 [Bacteroidota bacterium]|nr:hypothetical protein [Bacteroidota bacterium]
MRHLSNSILMLMMLCAAVLQSANAQSIEVTRNLPVGGPVVDFASIGDAVVLAIRSSGEILRSRDTARTWSLLETREADAALLCLLATDAGVIAGTRDGAILRSTDDGEQWNTLHRLPTHEAITDITTGDDALFAISEGGTILRSDNAGTHWIACATVPISPCTKLLRTSDSSYLVGSRQYGLLRSTDDGRSWHGPAGPPRSALISDFACCPCGGLLVSTHDYGCYHSADGGNSWDVCFSVGGTGSAPGTPALTVVSDTVVIIVQESGISRLFPHQPRTRPVVTDYLHCGRAVAGLSDGCVIIGDSLGCIHRTLLPPVVGDTTEFVSLYASKVQPLLRHGDYFNLGLSLWRQQQDQKSLPGGRISVLNELTGEVTVFEVGEGPGNTVKLRVDIPESAADGEYRLLCRVVDSPFDRGIVSTQYFTVDNRDAGAETRLVYQAEARDRITVLHGTPSGDIYCAAGAGLLMHSSDRGEQWRNLLPSRYSELTLRAITGDPSAALLAVLSDLTLILSRDGGESWQESAQLGDSAITDIACRGERVLVLTSSRYVLLSVDAARTWKDITPFIGTQYNGLYLPSDEQTVLVCRYGILESIDDGDSWSITQTPYGNPSVHDLFVAMDGTYHIPWSRALYRSTDLAGPWEYVIDRYLQLGWMQGITQTADGTIFGRYSTLLLSTDDGLHWENDAATSDTLPVLSMCAAGDDLILGTSQGELFIRSAKPPMSTRSAPAMPMACSIVSAHPNPAHGRAVITLRSATGQSAELTVHDMLGRRVATLFEGRLPVGNSSCVFDAHALPSGPYHLVLRTADGTMTENIMLLN